MKLIKEFVNVAAALAVVSIGASTAALADDAYNSGTACQPAIGSTAGDFDYNSSGTQNWSGSQRNVTCPMPRHSWPFGPTVNTARLTYSDNSTSSEFMCAFFACSETTGACSWTSIKWTCTTAGGCTSATSASSGIIGYLSWTGLSMITTGNNGFSCTMAGSTGSGASSVLAYRIVY
jgi:hypothetical protein